jgi:hypothetical protein
MGYCWLAAGSYACDTRIDLDQSTYFFSLVSRGKNIDAHGGQALL